MRLCLIQMRNKSTQLNSKIRHMRSTVSNFNVTRADVLKKYYSDIALLCSEFC